MKLIPKNVTGVLCYGKTLTLGLRCVDQSLKAVAGYLIFGKTVFLGFFLQTCSCKLSCQELFRPRHRRQEERERKLSFNLKIIILQEKHLIEFP